MSINTTIKTLGACRYKSPLKMATDKNDSQAKYVDENDAILLNLDKSSEHNTYLEAAGPRKDIYFEPAKVHAAIATCGGICPGLNNIIRSVVNCLWYNYGVRKISGIKYGYRGLLKESNFDNIPLNPQVVDDIHNQGGTILASARGGGDKVEEIVDTLVKKKVDIFFCTGGDGTLRGARDIQKEVEKRGLNISVIGIPKTIDNDLMYIQCSFGFNTAVSHASEVIRRAHTEAQNAINGIGLVKVMGREAGFIAAETALAQSVVDFCLIPENPFTIEGENGLLKNLELKLKEKGHAVILVAEGAGQDLLPKTGMKDLSGNIIFSDIGMFIKDKISQYFKSKKTEVNIKYIDPSYIIRASAANCYDAILCGRLGAHAVHAAMSGRTAVSPALMHDKYVNLPIDMITKEKNKVDVTGNLWRDVLERTRQPANII